MKRIMIAGLAGLIFGSGLVIAQMVNPAKVLGFLDLAGVWDPSLAFVMAGAVPAAAFGFRMARGRSAPMAAAVFSEPPARPIDARLIAGSILFGIGWGLVGLCPGPALAAIGIGPPAIIVFVAAMLGGIALFKIWERVSSRS